MSAPSPAQTFGHYTLLEELGRGGQGTVWLAEDHNLKRKVALKLLRTAAGTIDEHQLERFRREAEAASRLDHPNICPLFDAGDVDGVPYLAFRHIEGETLAERIASAQENDSGSGIGSGSATSKEGIQTTIALFEKLARALHKAHEQGLIHRDVKPGNIMITPEGEPSVLDFGLARDELADEHTLTHSGDLLGTPAYMSPEQLLAQRVPLDRRTDVYSLGATLYECLTGQRPFAAATRAELYQQILHSTPSSVSSTNRQIPRDLQVIVETAMEKDRNRRYQTSEDFAEDLRRFREFEPIRARPISKLLRVRRWGQRHPGLATALAATFVLLGIGLIGSWVFIGQLETQLRHTKALALVGESRDVAETNPKLALRLALAAVDTESQSETLSQLLAALALQHERAVLPIRDSIIQERATRTQNAFDFSPDGRYFVAANTIDPTARVFDISGREIHSLAEHDGPAISARFSPDGQHILSLSADHTARLWDSRSGVELERYEGHAGTVGCGAFSPDFDYDGDTGAILTTSADRTARLWTPHGKLIREFAGHEREAISPAFSPNYAEDGRFLTATETGPARIWHRDGGTPVELAEILGRRPQAMFSPSGVDPARVLTRDTQMQNGQAWLWDLSGQKRLTFGTPEIGITGSGFSPDGKYIWSTHWDQTVRITDVQGNRLLILPGESVPRHVGWSSDSSRIAVPYHDQIVRTYDLQGRELERFAGHSSRVWWTRFMADGVIASGSQDGTVRLWDVEAPGFPVLRGHDKSVAHVQFAASGRELLSAGEDGRVVRWDLDSGQHVPMRFDDSVWTVHYEPGGDAVLSACNDGAVRLSKRDGQTVLELRDSQGSESLCAAISLDAEYILAGWRDSTVQLFDRSGRELRRFEDHEAAIRSVAFSPRFAEDGRMASGSGNGTVRLWHRDGSVGPILRHMANVPQISFSADATRVLTASYDGTVRLWNLDGEQLWQFTGHEGPVHSAEFSPQGDRIVTSSRDKTVRILDLEGQEQLAIRSPGGFFLHATFSPDGKRVAAGAGAVVRIYPVVAEDLLRLAVGKAGEFTPEELERFGDLLPAR